MDQHSGSVIVGGTIYIDGGEFKDTTFRGVRLVYCGGPPPKFTNCVFDGCNFDLDGAAINTISYIAGLYHAGHTQIVDALVTAITGKPQGPKEQSDQQNEGDAPK